MLNKQYIYKILAVFIVTIFLTVILSSTIFAGPVSDKDITFSFQIPKDTLSQGEWNIFFISIGEFEKDNWTFDNYSEKIKSDYINFKKSCGNYSTFYETVYKMSEEESKHKGCVINGTYQEVYCFKTVSDNSICNNLAPYKINDKNKLDFGSYYNSYMWDINRADFYNHFSLSYCNVINDSCTFQVHKASLPYNPYIIVLEKANSSDEVYFSDKTSIKAVELFYNESRFYCSEPGCDVNVDMNITLKKFEIQNPNRLILEFDTQTKNIEHVQPVNWFNKFRNWLKSLFK
jgi:hypothetical protein